MLEHIDVRNSRLHSETDLYFSRSRATAASSLIHLQKAGPDITKMIKSQTL